MAADLIGGHRPLLFQAPVSGCAVVVTAAQPGGDRPVERVRDVQMGYLELTLRLSLAGVFLTSGVAKAREISDSAKMLEKLTERFLSKWSDSGLHRPAAWLLVATEMCTAVGLLVPGVTGKLSAAFSVALTASFVMVAILSALSVVSLSCACFGAEKTRLGWRHVWRNAGLLSIALCALFEVDGGISGGITPGSVMAALFIAVAVTLLVVYYDELAEMLSGNW
ncbi:hypothetical protein OG914_15920 [Streptomyces sp. NBC_00291]|uniref:MauE/DoxX family redox-associated membrane protein n=1 Tax=Streptomyces sp. NBC_00291 TaxID=2975704 RepID=UPI0022503588|nr:MauE/DoxX family redox-associated membrane protein [Streptomyces sp. NBC_00291]MCX5155470.1 hypothetical protein [Streptomyces sp. NBC_00291]